MAVSIQWWRLFEEILYAWVCVMFFLCKVTWTVYTAHSSRLGVVPSLIYFLKYKVISLSWGVNRWHLFWLHFWSLLSLSELDSGCAACHFCMLTNGIFMYFVPLNVMDPWGGCYHILLLLLFFLLLLFLFVLGLQKKGSAVPSASWTQVVSLFLAPSLPF